MRKFVVALIALAMVAAAVVLLRGKTESRAETPVMTELRKQILERSPSELGVDPKGNEPFVVVMDMAYPQAVVSLATVSTGDASLYFSTGGGFLGGFAHETVRKAAISFVQQAGRDAASFTPAADHAYPSVGDVRFLVRNAEGVRSATVSENELQSGKHPLSQLYRSGHAVITEFRAVAEAQQ